MGAKLLGVYVAGCIIYFCVSAAVNGLTLEKGLAKFFGSYKAQASPLVILTFALFCCPSFGLLHFTLWTSWHSEYSGIAGIGDAMYFSVVTMATVGYGDILPIGRAARWLRVTEIVSGVLLLVVGISASMTVWLQTNQPKDATESKWLTTPWSQHLLVPSPRPIKVNDPLQNPLNALLSDFVSVDWAVCDAAIEATTGAHVYAVVVRSRGSVFLVRRQDTSASRQSGRLLSPAISSSYRFPRRRGDSVPHRGQRVLDRLPLPPVGITPGIREVSDARTLILWLRSSELSERARLQDFQSGGRALSDPPFWDMALKHTPLLGAG